VPLATAGDACPRVANAVLFGAVALLAVPTLRRFAETFWSRPDDTHAPLVLLGVCLGFWLERGVFTWQTGTARRLAGLAFAGSGAAVLALGRSQMFYQLEGLGLLLFGCGALLASVGTAHWRRIALPGFLAVFLIPLPATLLDAVLLPLKLTLTETVVRCLAWLGLPVGSHGVVISVGFYQLQVADACAGLRSLLALTAIGLLFIHFVPSRAPHTPAILLGLIAPIALLANFCRITTLVLLTWSLGGDFSERAHNLAGYAEIALTLVLFVVAHRLLERGVAPRRDATP